jgi:hypothetical protein
MATTIKSARVNQGDKYLSTVFNNLRDDAVYLGQSSADAIALATAWRRHSQYINLEKLSTNRVRVKYTDNKPPTLVINGCPLQATAHVDSVAGAISGAAATWYLFAKRTAGSTTFTLEVATSATEGTDQRLIGSVYWSGTATGTLTVLDANSGGSAMKISTLPAQFLPNNTDGQSLTFYDGLVVISAATPTEYLVTGMLVVVGSTSDRVIEFYTGAPGAEIILTRQIVGSTGTITFPISHRIPAGTRVTVKTSGGTTAKVALQVYETGNLVDF